MEKQTRSTATVWLIDAAPSVDNPNRFDYDPMNPVPSYGGNVCCTGNAVAGGAFDQRKMATRSDILVYSTEPGITTKQKVWLRITRSTIRSSIRRR